MLGWSVQKSNKITFCHFANCAHHKTLHLHIHTQQMTSSNPTISQHSSSFVHVNTVLQIQHCSQSSMHPPPYQTTMLSSSNIANSDSNMPHRQTQHCPCTISRSLKMNKNYQRKPSNMWVNGLMICSLSMHSHMHYTPSTATLPTASHARAKQLLRTSNKHKALLTK